MKPNRTRVDPPAGLKVDLAAFPFGFQSGTGVALSPDGQSLYFVADFTTIVQTDLAGNLIATQQTCGDDIEDIDVILPQ